MSRRSLLATSSAAMAVLGATRTRQPRRSRKPAHCTTACSWEWTSVMSASRVPGLGSSWWSIFRRSDRTMEKRYCASRSYTAFTEPAEEFSIGTTP